MIAEFTIENFFSIKKPQTISFEPTSDTFMSDEYSCEVKDGVRLLKIGIIYGANASGKSNILNAIDFFKTLVLRMPQDRNEKTGVVPFLLNDTSRNETTKMSMAFYVNQTKFVLSFELDEKRICAETLIVYDSNRPTKLYIRSYDKGTDATTIAKTYKKEPRRYLGQHHQQLQRACRIRKKQCGKNQIERCLRIFCLPY